MYGDLRILTGTANPELAQQICEHLGCSLTNALTSEFSDGELRVEICDSVRGQDVFVVQPTCSPTNNNLMQLCLMIDALKELVLVVLLLLCLTLVMLVKIEKLVLELL